MPELSQSPAKTGTLSATLAAYKVGDYVFFRAKDELRHGPIVGFSANGQVVKIGPSAGSRFTAIVEPSAIIGKTEIDEEGLVIFV